MTLDQIKPHGDRLLVRPDPKLAETEGGLVIPDTVLADNPNYYTMTGTVVKIGDGVREDVYQCVNHQCRMEARRMVGERCPKCGAVQRLVSADGDVHAFDVQVGDRVLFGRFAGKQIEVEEFKIDIMGGIMSNGIVEFGDVVRGVPCCARYLMLREVELLGVLTGDERVLPGYEPAQWNKPTKGLTPTVTTHG